MAESKIEISEKPGRVLVLCVDRDDDIGVKGGMKTPIVGDRNVCDAAVTLALKDPEEPDSNAMFEAVKTYNHFASEEGKEWYQVAVIAGSRVGGVAADRKLMRELNQVLKAFPAEHVVLVSDGYSDEVVIPIIQSRVPIMSIKRVVVRHSETIEESWVLFGRYLKQLMEDPRYSRIALGVPGILFIFFAILWFFELLDYAWLVTLTVLGIVLFIKGFGVDRAVVNLARKIKTRPTLPPPHEQVRIYAAVAGIILWAIASYRGVAYIVQAYAHVPLTWAGVLSVLPSLIGVFIQQAMDLIVIGSCIYLIGSAISYYFLRDERIWQNLVGVVISITVYPLALEISKILIDPTYQSGTLVYWVGISIAISALSILVVYSLHRRYRYYFKRAEAVGES